MRWLKRSICLSWCRLVFQYLSFFCRYHRWLHCPTWHKHQCALIKSGLIRLSCKVQQQRLRLEEMGRLWNLILIFYHNQLIIFLRVKILILIRFLLQLSGRLRILIIRYSCQIIFWFCLSINQRFLFRWCSDLWRSCWQHLLFRRLIIQGGIIICRFRFWPHQ